MNWLLLILFLFQSKAPVSSRIDPAKQKQIEALAQEWFKARPATCFEDWNAKKYSDLVEKAKVLDPIASESSRPVREEIWKIARKIGPKFDNTPEFQTKWGKGTFSITNPGPGRGLIIGLHGGGPGAGDKGEAQGNWASPTLKSKLVGIYPQAINLVHDAWNTVEGERFVLTLIEMAKRTYDIDPDRVFFAGFSMGGTGSWFMAGRHPDLLAGSMPFHGVIFPEKDGDTIVRLHHGLLPNVRHVPMYYTTGSVDKNCPPESYIFAENVLKKLREEHGGDYEINYRCVPGLDHSFPAGEPQKGFDWILSRKRKTFPKKLTWEMTTNPYPQGEGRYIVHDFYWLRCNEPSDNMKIEAEIKDQTVDIKIDRHAPTGFTVFLSSELLDMNKEMKLIVNGETKFQGLLAPSFSAILETLSARFDRNLVLDHRIDF